MDTPFAIEMRGITKRFPGIVANDRVDFSVRENEVHALLGENGAGKSTLMSILFGSYAADQGTIRIRGREAHIRDPNDATALGIGMVHQHFKLIRSYTVAENIVLGAEPRNRLGLLNLRAAAERVRALSERYGLRVNPQDKIEDITVGMQQRVEILKVLYRNAHIIILDEPTAVLTPQEIDELMEIIRHLKAEGKTLVIITHKLREIKAVAERCTVLRRGRLVGTVDVPAVTEGDLVEMMVGRIVQMHLEKAPAHPGQVVLSVRGISVKNSRGQTAVRNLSLEVHAGEILGIAGVDGNGQAELIYAICGMAALDGGSIFLEGADISTLSIRKRIARGIGHVPEDRHRHGLVAPFTVGENLALKTYYKPPLTARGAVLDYQAMNAQAGFLIDAFDIRAGQGALTPADSMSGGNQQKMIIAREISINPRLLIVAQPTRGLDVGAIEYIRTRIMAQRDNGRAVLLVSFELEEIMNLCDRIATISRGSIAAIRAAGEVTEQEIGAMMAGQRKRAAAWRGDDED
jgi:simple sugar transport system ATP-binding protein